MANTRRNAHQESKPHRPERLGGQGMGQGRGMNPARRTPWRRQAASPVSARNQRRSRRRTSRDMNDGNDQIGGDRSGRAAHSGATGERSTSGGRNKPEPKNQDEKGMGHPRNR